MYFHHELMDDLRFAAAPEFFGVPYLFSFALAWWKERRSISFGSCVSCGVALCGIFAC